MCAANYEGPVMPDDEPAAIELRHCLYQVRCNVRACQAKATMIARSVDVGGRLMKQYELCDVHAKQVRVNAPKGGRSSK
jgi:hypothetical protein